METNPTGSRLERLIISELERLLGGVSTEYDAVAKRLRDTLRSGGLDAFQEALRGAFDTLAPRVFEALTEAFEQAIESARAAFVSEVVQAYGPERAAAIRILGPYNRAAFIRTLLEAPGIGGFTISDRYWKSADEIRQSLRAEMQSLLRKGKGAISGAEQLRNYAVNDERLPRHLRNVEEAARAALKGNPDALKRFKEMVAQAKKIIQHRKAGPLGSQGFQRKFVNSMVSLVKKGNEEALGSAIEDYIARRAKYRATVLLRTETNRAFQFASLREWDEKEWVLAVRWALSQSHGQFDECDLKAKADIGLGPGVYYKQLIPWPDHPNGICHLRPVLAEPEDVSQSEAYVPSNPQAYNALIKRMVGPVSKEANRWGRRKDAGEADDVVISKLLHGKNVDEIIKERDAST